MDDQSSEDDDDDDDSLNGEGMTKKELNKKMELRLDKYILLFRNLNKGNDFLMERHIKKLET